MAILGIPFDSGVSYRPGARFGPSAIRQASRMLRPQFHPIHEMEPFALLQGADAGDVACNPFDIGESIAQIERGADELLRAGRAPIVSIGGDHTVSLPILRSMHRQHGPVALVHFDAHLDTWDTYFGAPYTHGTLLRRAAEEGLFRTTPRCTSASAGRSTARRTWSTMRASASGRSACEDVHREGVDGVVERIRERVGDHPLYISIDIDSLDPAHAPGHRHARDRRARRLVSC